jgi:hypothetical protein
MSTCLENHLPLAMLLTPVPLALVSHTAHGIVAGEPHDARAVPPAVAEASFVVSAAAPGQSAGAFELPVRPVAVILQPARKESYSLRPVNRVARWYIFKPKSPIWVNVGGSCNRTRWCILWLFGLFYNYLVDFRVSWAHFPPFWYAVSRKIWQPCLYSRVYTNIKKWIRFFLEKRTVTNFPISFAGSKKTDLFFDVRVNLAKERKLLPEGHS